MSDRAIEIYRFFMDLRTPVTWRKMFSVTIIASHTCISVALSVVHVRVC